jgi:hypothetical protein
VQTHRINTISERLELIQSQRDMCWSYTHTHTHTHTHKKAGMLVHDLHLARELEGLSDLCIKREGQESNREHLLGFF